MASETKKRQIVIFSLISVLALAIAVAVYSMVVTLNHSREDRDLQTLLTSIQSEIYDLMVVSQDAAVGDIESIAGLPAIEQSIFEKQQEFASQAEQLDPTNVRRFNEQINNVTFNLRNVEDQSGNIEFLREQLFNLEASIPSIQQSYTQVVDTMLESNSPADQVAEAQAQIWRLERALASLNRILGGDDMRGSYDPLAAAGQFRSDVLVFVEVFIGMRDGNRVLGISQVENPSARLLLDQVEIQFQGINESIEALVGAAPALSITSESADAILRTGAELLTNTQGLSTEIAGLPDRFDIRPFSSLTMTIAMSIAATVALIIGLLIIRGTRENLLTQRLTNETNQEAILRLLDEIADLGEGDLTVNATVSEDFTGAIADSINYAIEQLRELVANVVITAENVAGASNETRAIALRLNEASEHQSSQISDTTKSIAAVADNLTSVSADAEELASVAQSSVVVASKGNQVVQNSITGMNDIREQIQDTAKRIKRLGESSQEIGDIVSLINDIADQTNILALNASIQAAMAGEAGRGFAVVADEVQGLAERATASTKQIESLVRAIQTDTNETVESMEQTTAEVVRGAELANSAGESLTEIQSTSENLAKLILAISGAAKEQSEQANRASRSMRVISDITEQTLSGSAESGKAIGELAEQAVRLRSSVDDFKLPDGTSSSFSNNDLEATNTFNQTSDLTDIVLKENSAESLEELESRGEEEKFENEMEKTRIMNSADFEASSEEQSPQIEDSPEPILRSQVLADEDSSSDTEEFEDLDWGIDMDTIDQAETTNGASNTEQESDEELTENDEALAADIDLDDDLLSFDIDLDEDEESQP